jgi:K+-transporting ATPase ATPase A chain
MPLRDWATLALYLGVLVALVRPLGEHMARVYAGGRCGLEPLVAPLERWLYRRLGVRQDAEQAWRAYAVSLLVFNLLGLMAVYALQRLQAVLPLDPAALPAVPADLALNTAASFASNTNWQSYAGEGTMSHLTQMLGMTVQNFLSAATGMAVLAALARGIARRSAATIGCFWVDMVRGTLYILLPLSLVLAVALASQGVVQTFAASVTVGLVEATPGATTQAIAVGPAASQVAIKQIGTNGGGFFGVNSAHPLENPTSLAGFLECLAILLVPAALCRTYGRLVGDTRQGWAVLAAMLLILVPLTVGCMLAEHAANPRLEALGVAGASMEGKEVRIGPGQSALWAAATTAASNGSVNAMHDSFMPLGGMVPMVLMQLGEVVLGGVGSGLYGMLVFVIITVFIAGLMIGRTPEYMGKKIEVFEIKMASLVILVPCAAVLLGTALAWMVPGGMANADGSPTVPNPGPHGFSEVLYWASSTGNNNGSAFAGLGTNVPFYNIAGAVLMIVSRYWIIVPVLAIAGSLARKRAVPAGLGTLPTHGPLFVCLLVGIVVLVGALTFLPALALGPVVEHLQLFR